MQLNWNFSEFEEWKMSVMQTGGKGQHSWYISVTHLCYHCKKSIY